MSVSNRVSFIIFDFILDLINVMLSHDNTEICILLVCIM